MESSKLTPCIILVFVVAVSEPKLSLVPAVDGGVTLQCEAYRWFPEPELTFLDEQGNNIKAEDPKSNQDSGRCFTVTRRVTVQTASSRFNISNTHTLQEMYIWLNL